jgi:gliding motility associated protien GldN
MKNYFVKLLVLLPFLCLFSLAAEAQKGKKRSSSKRANTTTKKTTKGKTKATISPVTVDSTQTTVVAPPPAPKVNDSLPIKKVKKSLRMDEAVDSRDIRDRDPLPYEHIRIDDAVYRHKLWRDIDTREKINLPFRYAADEQNGNQRFISIIMQAIQDSLITVFDPIDDRFTTPMSKADVVKKLAGEPVEVQQYDSIGQVIGSKFVSRDVVLDSFMKFRIKEEVIFDKESSRLHWRILGIAPLYNVYSSQTNQLVGVDNEAFWIYYPDLRPVLAKYEIYNGKNFGARPSWEELFENRMFSGRIIKSTVDNPFNKFIDEIPGLKGNGVFQLLEGERIKEKIFNYELDLWSY